MKAHAGFWGAYKDDMCDSVISISELIQEGRSCKHSSPSLDGVMSEPTLRRHTKPAT